MGSLTFAGRELVQPVGGLFRPGFTSRAWSFEPQFTTHLVRSGDLTPALWEERPSRSDKGAPRTIAGGGTAASSDVAEMLAVAEGVERYSACAFKPGQVTLASAEQLGDEALDLDTIPRCSETELADPLCPLTLPSKQAVMRWVRALSLLDGRVMFVPAVMAYLSAGFADRNERIALPISTGCAAHVSYESALLGAIFEVVERDAISLVWLQKLPLPVIDVDETPVELREAWQRHLRSTPDLQCTFFDATTDVGCPTLYGVQQALADRQVTTVLACSTDRDYGRALSKVIRDMASIRIAMRRPRTVPERWSDFQDVMDGATYMAAADRGDAFEFLMQPARRMPLSGYPRAAPATDREVLRALLARFRQLGMALFAVDLSTDEAIRAGFRVVRVLIPALQPLSFHYRARYLGHPRLYSAPANMGYAVRTEAELNPWPQAFG
jgi:ribosomal protein S12 methylthiotransferase accessory factor